MDFVNKFTGSSNTEGQQQQQQQPGQGGGMMDKFNSAMGGGQAGEKNEDMLDKGVDFVQERFMGAGPQDNESAIEQAKDEQISDGIRRAAKGAGFDIPIQDKS
ncbi:hypothetical protein M408DRAFT_168887 [Serendipita vermifera MAFF 305830]|uniref:DNA damage-responsive protein 48 n=1 Tax=Serendipita vermifera MAFF 305830 TaxID=933852 RepID=A0A0C2WLY1_SERVB|nr:hypothetical protein M408DRAFT_168887 [Serendipita vermifera MAFF 305830]